MTITKTDFAAAHTRVEGVMVAKGSLTEEGLFDLYYELCPDGQPTAVRIQNERGSGDAVSGRDCVEFSLCGDPLAEPPSMVLLEAYHYPLGFFNDSVGQNEPVRAPEYDIALKLRTTPWPKTDKTPRSIARSAPISRGVGLCWASAELYCL